MLATYLRTLDEQQCYGCGACEQICPKNAISMSTNKEGFAYPLINIDNCVKCGACLRACPYENNLLVFRQPVLGYAIQYKNSNKLLNSSSGAAFPAIADYVLSKGGYVAGCIFTENFRAVHVVTNKPETVERMSGSKYVQSDTIGVYSEIKYLLNLEKLVLFSGTPCQVAGLYSFLDKYYDNLITVDLICHGVPSPKLMEEYLSATYNGKIIDFKFRDKKLNGWSSAGSILIQKKNGRIKKKRTSPLTDSYYYYYYLQNCVNRMSCYSCKFASIKRVSDITIGDYWNIDKIFPEIDTRNGYSAVLINTQKGQSIIDKIQPIIHSLNTKVEDIANNNGNLQRPSPLPKQRFYIYDKIEREGYMQVSKEECHYSFIKSYLKRIMPHSIKKIIKKSMKK